MGWVGSEVEGLKFGDDGKGKFSLSGKSLRLPTIVTSMPKLFAHESVSVMSIVRLFRDVFISLKVTCPWKLRPTDSSSCCMRVAGLTGGEVFIVSKEVPFNCSDTERLP
jgi:hypothetical protein